MHYLYRITNQLNGKNYIGQTINLRKRWYDHRKGVENPSQVIHHAMAKYGIDNFTFEWIATCKSQEDANDTETILVTQYESHVSTYKGYNVTFGGMNALKTEAWKLHMSEVMTGNQNCLGHKHTEESKQLMSKIAMGNQKALGNTNRLGQTNTEESKLKTSETLKQKHVSGEIAAWNKGIASEKHPMFGKKMSEESKAKMRAAKLGKPSPKKGKKYS